ncbi:hypothetical protein [Corynebacterium uterequi]|nr:hypothetical protein [Corynebacterium uterequi]
MKARNKDTAYLDPSLTRFAGYAYIFVALTTIPLAILWCGPHPTSTSAALKIAAALLQTSPFFVLAFLSWRRGRDSRR